MQGPAWFTIKEAASYLNVGEPTIYRWMREARITYRKVGDSTRFLQEDLDSLVEVFPSKKNSGAATEFCPMCHSAELVAGDLRGTGRIYFHPSRTRFWTLDSSHIQTRAHMCARCGFVMVRADREKLVRLREQNRQALEQQQVLEEDTLVE